MAPHSILVPSPALLTCLLLLLLGRVDASYPASSCPQSCRCTNTLVNCTGRNLNFVPEDLPPWAEVLLLANNPLESLVAQQNRLIITPNNLSQIDFSNTNLRIVKADFLSKLFNDVIYIDSSLQSISFDNNQLSIFPVIHHASNLHTLTCSNNKLELEAFSQVDISIQYPLLESLDISDNAIGHIPKHFLSTTVNSKLHTLVLHNTRIETIEAGAFDLLIHLKVLKLSRNNLQFLTNEWLGHLSNLRELDLSSNRIDQIGTLAFNGSKSLEVLKMRRNKLNNLPDGSFWGLSKLQKLNLDHNNVSDIRLGWTYGLNSLTELTLRHNAVKDIQAGSWNPTPNLLELYLNQNQLEQIDSDTFSKLHSLKILKLNNNRITVILENAFNSLTSLDTFDLSNNKISVAIESSNGFFANLKSLKKLRLESNEIRRIQKHTFSGLSNLTHLSLSSNPISSIQNGSFSWFQHLHELNLEDTDLVCDCTMKWLLEWLQSTDLGKKFASKMRCKHPSQLYLRTANSFLDASLDAFHCQHFLKPHMIDDFQSIDKPISAIKGKNMTFYCKVATSSSDKVQFKWIKDSHVISDSHGRVKYETLASSYSANATLYTNVFTLLNVQDEDEGSYQCMASNSYDSVYSHKFQVNVHVIPYFIKKPQNITVKVGHTARLECAAKGQPAPHVSWQKDAGENFPAAAERRMRFIPSDDVYFIVDVTKNDIGAYTCNASNDAGTVISTVHLNVIEPPSFVRKMVDKEAQSGSTVSLECMAAGIPMPKITWYKDDVVLAPTERHFFTAEGQLLIIVKLNPTDQGQYSCSISNVYGSAQDSFYLSVLSRFLSPGKSPVASLAPVSIPVVDAFDTFFNFMQSHGILLLIIVLACSVLTSFIWIIIICHLRRKDKRHLTKDSTTEDVENFSDHEDDSADYGLPSRPEPTRVVQPFFSPFTELDYQADYESESSSAKVFIAHNSSYN